MPRWICKRCNGPAKIAPKKARKNDVRRYCLPCTEKTGFLVLRTCPTVETKQAQRKDKRAEKTKKVRAKRVSREARRYTIEGIDLRKELKRLVEIARVMPYRVPVLGTRMKMQQTIPFPELDVRWSTLRSSTSGHAWQGMNRMVLTLGTACDRAEAVEVLAHELAHLVAPVKEHHGPLFHTLLGDLLERAYDIRQTASIGLVRKQSLRDSMFRKQIRETEWFRATALREVTT